MKKLTIYLAGPIAGELYQDATEWRVAVASHLQQYNIDCRDPMRDKQSLKEAGQIATDSRHYSGNGILYSSDAIMQRDYNDVISADALFVNLLGTDTSIGTCMELAWAYHLRKPVIAVIEPDNRHFFHPMATAAIGPFRAETLHDGVDLLLSVLGKG